MKWKVKVKKCRKYENNDNTTCSRKKKTVRNKPKALTFAAYIEPVFEPSSSDFYLNSSCCHCSIAFKMTRKFTVKIINNASSTFERKINATKSYFDWITKFVRRQS